MSPRCAQKTPRLHYKTVRLMLFWGLSLRITRHPPIRCAGRMRSTVVTVL